MLWLNDRLGSIVSARVALRDGPPASPVLAIGDSELHHWTDGETPEYLAHQLEEHSAGSYRLGSKILINLEPLAADTVYRANNLHLVIDLDMHVSLRLTGHKADL